jgi:L-ribulose-5-phosphate 4-epimerase
MRVGKIMGAGLRKEAVRAAQRAYSIGLQLGSGGNLSVRVPGASTVLIKPSGVSFGDCTEKSLVEVDLDGRPVGGQGAPSRELLTHLAIYRSRPDVGGVFHCHAAWAIACAASLEAIPLHTYHAESKLGLVPVVTVEGSANEAFVHAVEALFSDHRSLHAFVQSRHGIFAIGNTIREAEDTAELVEETSKIAMLIKQGLTIG